MRLRNRLLCIGFAVSVVCRNDHGFLRPKARNLRGPRSYATMLMDFFVENYGLGRTAIWKEMVACVRSTKR